MLCGINNKSNFWFFESVRPLDKLNEVVRWNTGHDEMTFQLLPRWNMNVVVLLHFASQRGCFAYWKCPFGCYHDETWMSHAAACCDKATEWQPCISFPSKGLRAVASFSISSNLAAATCQHCFCPKEQMVLPNRFSYRSKILRFEASSEVHADFLDSFWRGVCPRYLRFTWWRVKFFHRFATVTQCEKSMIPFHAICCLWWYDWTLALT